MSTRLDPDEALAGPLYAVAGMLVIVPLTDFLLSVPPPQLSSVQWRFATAGLFSSYIVQPILGLALAFVVAGAMKHHTLQRLLVVLCLSAGAGLLVLSALFLLDVMQVGASVPPEGRPAFDSAWKRAMIKHVFAGALLLFLGWRARRMIPARVKHRATPKPVHVVSK